MQCGVEAKPTMAHLVIEDGVTSIGDNAFYNCSALTSVTIPNSVINIESDAFYSCVRIKQATATAIFFDIPESNWPYYTQQLDSVIINNGELTDNMLGFVKRSYKSLRTLDVSAVENTSLPDEAFKECYNLRTLILPADLERISYMAVADCKNLQSIDIPTSVEDIDQSAFENCRSLTTITFGDIQPSPNPGKSYAPMTETSHLKKIGNWAFYNAHELQHLTLPEGVEEIGDGAFYGCTYLEDLVLPSSVHSIGDNCFALCSRIAQMKVEAALPPKIEDKTFFEVSTTAPVYVPDESVDTYKSHAVWGKLNIQGRANAPTAITNTFISEKVTKLLRNGQILILRGDKTYTIQGQEVR